MPAKIVAERPDTPHAIALIDELENALSPLYPDESRHGYSVEKLLREHVDFFVLRQDGAPAGCGGIQFFGHEYGELKRMYIRPTFRRQGLGKLVLNHLIDHARRRWFNVVRLETGIYQQEAIALYQGAGFLAISPFGNYKEDPLSLFLEKRLD